MTSDSGPSVRRGGRAVFYGAVVVAIGLVVVGLGELLALAVLGWLDAAALDGMYPGAAMHRMHVLAQGAMAWLIAIGVLTQPWRSSRTFAAALVALTVLVAYTAAAAVGRIFDPLALTGIVALGVMAWAHPGRPTARAPLDRWMLVHGAPLIAGSMAVAAEQLVVQLSAGSRDPHAAIGHYGLTAAMALGLAVATLIGATSLPGRTLAAWLAVGGAVYYGLASIVFPAEASSLGPVGGVVAVGAAGVFAYGVVRSGPMGEPATPEPRPQLLG